MSGPAAPRLIGHGYNRADWHDAEDVTTKVQEALIEAPWFPDIHTPEQADAHLAALREESAQRRVQQGGKAEVRVRARGRGMGGKKKAA